MHTAAQVGEAPGGRQGKISAGGACPARPGTWDEPPQAPGHSQTLASTPGYGHLLVHAQPRPNLLLQQLLGLHPGGDELLPGAGGHRLLVLSPVRQAQGKLADLKHTGPCSYELNFTGKPEPRPK